MKATLLAACSVALTGGQAMAALVASPAPILVSQSFDGGSAALQLHGSTEFIFSDNSAKVAPDDTTYPFVAVMTLGGGSVYAPGGTPYSAPDQTAFPVSIGPAQQADFQTFASPQGIPYSLGKVTIALADLYLGQTYYGYATFDGTTLVSYGFQSTPGLAATLPAVPLPASAPLFGAAILILGGVAYGRRRGASSGAF